MLFALDGWLVKGCDAEECGLMASMRMVCVACLLYLSHESLSLH